MSASPRVEANRSSKRGRALNGGEFTEKAMDEAPSWI
jgi:hypothetical protein